MPFRGTIRVTKTYGRKYRYHKMGGGGNRGGTESDDFGAQGHFDVKFSLFYHSNAHHSTLKHSGRPHFRPHFTAPFLFNNMHHYLSPESKIMFISLLDRSEDPI